MGFFLVLGLFGLLAWLTRKPVGSYRPAIAPALFVLFYIIGKVAF